MSEQIKDLSQVRCRIPGCRFVSTRAVYAVRWAQWSQHYLDEHYDPRWDVPCPHDEDCRWVSRASSVIDHQRAQHLHATEHEDAA